MAASFLANKLGWRIYNQLSDTAFPNKDTTLHANSAHSYTILESRQNLTLFLTYYDTVDMAGMLEGEAEAFDRVQSSKSVEEPMLNEDIPFSAFCRQYCLQVIQNQLCL